MLLLATFIAIALVGQTGNVLLAILLERISENVSLAFFFVVFAGVFYASWQLAVRIIDRMTNQQAAPLDTGRPGR